MDMRGNNLKVFINNGKSKSYFLVYSYDSVVNRFVDYQPLPTKSTDIIELW